MALSVDRSADPPFAGTSTVSVQPDNGKLSGRPFPGPKRLRTFNDEGILEDDHVETT